MKYTKSIIVFMSINFILLFLMIFIANKTRELEKKNNDLKINISKINESLQINKIELITHKNSSYLKKLYLLYFSNSKKNNMPNILTFEQFSSKDQNNQNIKLVNTNN